MEIQIVPMEKMKLGVILPIGPLEYSVGLSGCLLTRYVMAGKIVPMEMMKLGVALGYSVQLGVNGYLLLGCVMETQTVPMEKMKLGVALD